MNERLIMKKIITLLLSIVLIFALTGCGEEKTTDGTNINEELNATSTASEYFPTENGLVLNYSGSFENGGETYTLEYVHDNKVQIRIANDGASSVSVFNVSEDEVRLSYLSIEEPKGSDLTSENNIDDYIVIKGPIKVGTTWTVNDDVKKTITAINKEVEVPAGTFSAIEITTVYDEEAGTKAISYFTKEIGLIKDTYYSGENKFDSELLSIIHPE